MSGSEKNGINLNVGSGLFSMECDSIPSGVLDVGLPGVRPEADVGTPGVGPGVDAGLLVVSPEADVGTPGVSHGVQAGPLVVSPWSQSRSSCSARLPLS